MLSLFKRKPTEAKEATFKTRVQQFWAWYIEAAPRFYQTIEARKSMSLAAEVNAAVDGIIPGFAWVFGPGENGQGHSFTLSGEGNMHRQLLALYWLEQAPSLPGWTFYAARQPGSIRGLQMNMGGHKFDPLAFWVTPFVNHDEEKLDITVWHPLFDEMPERDRWTVLFLFLDEVLGEYGTQQWIGEIKLEPKRLGDSMPLEELKEFSERIQAEHGWRKLLPGKSATLYSLPEQHSRFLRGDIVTGTTMHPRLVNEYLKAEGDLEDPLAGTGADYVFVAFDARFLPAGNEARARGEIEDAVDSALRTSASGRLLGGAWGKENAYIDLLLFDGPASIDEVIGTLRERNLPSGSTINYFARNKRGHRQVI
jgi:hypothetical protein